MGCVLGFVLSTVPRRDQPRKRSFCTVDHWQGQLFSLARSRQQPYWVLQCRHAKQQKINRLCVLGFVLSTVPRRDQPRKRSFCTVDHWQGQLFSLARSRQQPYWVLQCRHAKRQKINRLCVLGFVLSTVPRRDQPRKRSFCTVDHWQG